MRKVVKASKEAKKKVKMNLLDDKSINALEIKEKEYKVTDGRGLYVLVSCNGTKSWKLKYRYNGVEKKLSFGIYPFTSIAIARYKRDDAWRLLNEGYDPSLTYAAKKTKIMIESKSVKHNHAKMKRAYRNREEFLLMRRAYIIKMLEVILDEDDIDSRQRMMSEINNHIKGYWAESECRKK